MDRGPGVVSWTRVESDSTVSADSQGQKVVESIFSVASFDGMLRLPNGDRQRPRKARILEIRHARAIGLEALCEIA